MLIGLGAALAVAFVVAPPTLAAGGSDSDLVGSRHLVAAFRGAFVDYWSAGKRDLSPDLQRIVDYWFRFHVAKAVIAALLLIVLVRLGVLLWKAYLRAGGLRAAGRAALAAGGVLVTMLAVFALTVVMANIQGAIKPLSSLLPMLMESPADGRLADALEQIRQRLADSPGGGELTPPPLDAMIRDYSQSHLVMVVVAAIVAVVLIGMSVVSWRRFASTGSTERRTRRVCGSFGVLFAVLALAAIVVVVANAGTVADPMPGFSAFFNGSW